MEEKEKQKIAMEITPKWRKRKEQLRALSVEELWLLDARRVYIRISTMLFFLFFIIISPWEYFLNSLSEGGNITVAVIVAVIKLYANVFVALYLCAMVYGMIYLFDHLSGNKYMKRAKQILKELKNGK